MTANHHEACGVCHQMVCACPAVAKRTVSKLEVHEHHFITGPRAYGLRSKFAHSHEGGNQLGSGPAKR